MNTHALPPGEKWRQYELRALGLRDFAGAREDAALDPFALARYANLLVVDFDQVKGLSRQAREHLLGDASEQWSGGASSRPLPNGKRIVILNPNHGPQRTKATLMEEICHVFLGHQPNRLSDVAKHFRVSRQLVEYRLKVTHLWSIYKSAHPEEQGTDAKPSDKPSPQRHRVRRDSTEN